MNKRQAPRRKRTCYDFLPLGEGELSRAFGKACVAWAMASLEGCMFFGVLMGE